MKLLRHILSHTFLILFIAGLVSVFYYRSLLLAPDINEKIDTYVSELYPPAVSFTSGRDYFWAAKIQHRPVLDNLVISDQATATADTAVVNEVMSITPAEVELTPVSDVPAPAVLTEEIAVADPVNTDTTEQMMAAVEAPQSVVTQPEIIVAEKIEQAAAESVSQQTPVSQVIADSVNVPENDAKETSDYDVLVNARNAFNYGNLSLSEKFYQELADRDANNPDVYGELGNVYYAQGKWQQAGRAYYEAAARLIRQGRKDQVVYLQRVIKGLDADSADKLAQLINNN